MLGTTRLTVPMFDVAFARLLEEDRKLLRQERRASERVSLVRPVTVQLARGEEATFQAFSRNLAPQGISLIHQHQLTPRRIALLAIHSLSGSPVYVRSELRWVDDFGDGWYHTGWEFLAMSRT